MTALFSLNTLVDTIYLNSLDKIELFDSLAIPILYYGSEVWGFHSRGGVERLHLKFLKQLLGVNQRTASSAVYDEFARYLCTLCGH